MGGSGGGGGGAGGAAAVLYPYPKNDMDVYAMEDTMEDAAASRWTNALFSAGVNCSSMLSTGSSDLRSVAPAAKLKYCSCGGTRSTGSHTAGSRQRMSHSTARNAAHAPRCS